MAHCVLRCGARVPLSAIFFHESRPKTASIRGNIETESPRDDYIALPAVVIGHAFVFGTSKLILMRRQTMLMRTELIHSPNCIRRSPVVVGPVKCSSTVAVMEMLVRCRADSVIKMWSQQLGSLTFDRINLSEALSAATVPRLIAVKLIAFDSWSGPSTAAGSGMQMNPFSNRKKAIKLAFRLLVRCWCGGAAFGAK